MFRGHVVRASVLVTVLIGTSGCALGYLMPASRAGSYSAAASQACAMWGTTMGSDRSGESTPLAAVLKAAGEQHEPLEGWLSTSTGPDAQTFSSGSYTIHVLKLPDGTWFADNGSSCGEMPTIVPPSPTAPAAP
jgi:hypothetical protein